MWLGVIFLLAGGFGSLSAGSVTATAIMALSLASALLLLDLAGKPKPRSPRSIIGFGLLAVASASDYLPLPWPPHSSWSTSSSPGRMLAVVLYSVGELFELVLGAWLVFRGIDLQQWEKHA
jgi:hypothetical protein